MADYYARQTQGTDPFNWIKGHPLMTQEIIAQYLLDHAGKGETITHDGALPRRC
jgi:hypothetical protein